MTIIVQEKVLVLRIVRHQILIETVKKRRILIRSLKTIGTHTHTWRRRVMPMIKMMITVALKEGITETVNQIAIVGTAPVNVVGIVTIDAVTGDHGSRVLVAVIWGDHDVVLSTRTVDEAVVEMIVIDSVTIDGMIEIADLETVDGTTSVIVEAM